MKPVIIFLSTYPHRNPRHGGQIRVANIIKLFTDSGWQTESIAVYEPGGYGECDVGINDLPFPGDSPYRHFCGRYIPAINDLSSGRYAIAEDGCFNLIKARLPRRIDVICVEQPYMWPLARKIKNIDQYNNVLLVYGSHNIEASLKRDIFSCSGIGEADDALKAVDEVERQAAREADLVFAVTKHDLDVLATYGAKKLFLAPNGVAPWYAKEVLVNKWREKLPKAPWILYVASAHAPNYTGFTACIGESLGCIPPDSKLVIAGGVCEYIYRCLDVERYGGLNLSRIQLLHILSDDDLAAVKTLAHGFLLPIQHGSGSNLKTAEAIFSGAYVIGTEVAFRGFEDFTTLPEIKIVRSQQEFQTEISNVLCSKPLAYKHLTQSNIRYQLRWDQCLAPILEMVTQNIKIRGTV